MRGCVIDVLQDKTITPQIEIISHEPDVCDIKNKKEIKKKIENIVKL